MVNDNFDSNIYEKHCGDIHIDVEIFIYFFKAFQSLLFFYLIRQIISNSFTITKLGREEYRLYIEGSAMCFGFIKRN